MKRAILLLALFLPSLATGTAVTCSVAHAVTCTLNGVQASSTYFVQIDYGHAVPVVSPSSTFGLTFTTIRCDNFNDGSFGSNTICAYYARTGTNSGNDTISFAGLATVFSAIAESFPATDVRVTGNPVDNSCFTTGTFPTGNSSVDTCRVTSSAPNDIYQYWIYGTIAASCSFGIPFGINNGPTVARYLSGLTGCDYNYVNLFQPGSANTIVASGAPQSVLVNVTWSNTSSLVEFMAAQHILLFAGSGGGIAKRKLPPYYVKFQPRRTRRMIRVVTEGL